MSNATPSRRGFLRGSIGAAAIALAVPLVMFGHVLGSDVNDPTNSTGERDEIPEKLFLGQNYPNPFHGLTAIRYGIPADTHVRLSLHTLLGAEVQVVVERYQQAGVYTCELSSPSLPSGVYFYRIQTDQGTLTRRMTVSR